MNQKKIGVVLSYGQIVVTILSNLLYTPIMFNLLGAAEYGVYSLSSSIIGYFYILYTGMTSTYMRFYSRYKGNNEYENIGRLNGLFLVIFSVLGIIIFCIGILLSQNLTLVLGQGLTDNEIELAEILFLIMSVNMAVLMPKTVFATIVFSQERFIFIKTLGIVTAIASPLINLPLLYMGYGSIGMSYVALLITLLDLIVNIYYCCQKIHCRFSVKSLPFFLLPEMAWFSIFILLNGVINLFLWSFGKILLSYVADSKAIAIYSVGVNINTLYLSLSNVFCGMATPQIYKLVQEKKVNELTDLWIKLGRCQFYIMFLVWCAFLLWGREFIYLWAGPEYDEAYFIALIFITPLVIYLCQNTGIEVLRAYNKHRQWVIIHFISAVLGFGISIPLSHLYAGIGVAVGTSINTFIVLTFYDNWYFYKVGKLGIFKFFKDFMKFLPAASIVLAVGGFISYSFPVNSWLGFSLIIMIFTILYSVVMYMLAMNNYEKTQVRKAFNFLFRLA